MNGDNTRRIPASAPEARNLTLSYGSRPAVSEVDLTVPAGSFTVIVGPNGCGKSTLLRGLGRILTPRSGSVVLDGEDIGRLPTKAVARRLGLLPQGPIAPEGITVSDLVARGRHPHQSVFRPWSAKDEAAVAEALDATAIRELAGASVDELSGGQRQRVWLALVLAQQTPTMLLDEPTTYLDIAHQIDVLDLCADLQHRHGRTLVAVLHDLNHACRYATHLVAMRDGGIVAQGSPGDVVTAELVEDVFGLACRVINDPETQTPLVIPLRRDRRTGDR